jgi:hypothetical protein
MKGKRCQSGNVTRAAAEHGHAQLVGDYPRSFDHAFHASVYGCPQEFPRKADG